MPLTPKALVGSEILTPGLGVNPVYQSLNPDEWLISTFRALKAYVERNIDQGLYEFVGSFAEADELARELPLVKTVIHFEIDEVMNYPLGMGDGVVSVIEDTAEKTVIGHEAQWHEINFDVGVWASDQTGGVTARMEAYELLIQLFDGPSSLERVRDETDGIEIRHFRGGRFDVEKVGDLRVYRVMDMEMVVRVAGRKTSAERPYIDVLIPDQRLEIDGQPITG